MQRSAAVLAAIVATALLAAGSAWGGGGRYHFSGGTPAQRATVRAALDASAFPWSVVGRDITIRIAPGAQTSASPGLIVLDANLLDEGRFAWGVVQHEFAHQVDFLLLDDAVRARLLRILGGVQWCWGPSRNQDLEHAEYGCERFASTLAWAYWPSDENVLKPQSPADESAAVPPIVFRLLMEAVFVYVRTRSDESLAGVLARPERRGGAPPFAQRPREETVPAPAPARPRLRSHPVQPAPAPPLGSGGRPRAGAR